MSVVIVTDNRGCFGPFENHELAKNYAHQTFGDSGWDLEVLQPVHHGAAVAATQDKPRHTPGHHTLQAADLVVSAPEVKHQG